MGGRRYDDACGSCRLARGEEEAGGGILEMPGGWIVSHYSGREAFLGWLYMQPRYHRDDFASLTRDELDSLGPDIRAIGNRVERYWRSAFPHDELRRIYVVYFSESAHDDPTPGRFHMHLYLIPRLASFDLLLRRPSGEGSAIDPWEIRRVTAHRDFPTEYSPSHSEYADSVEALMEDLRAGLQGD